jgi:hypothetical protein
MYIVAIAWIYVVLMMSITETSVVAGVMTFALYGILPLTIILYLMAGPQRRRRRAAAAQQDLQASVVDSSVVDPGTADATRAGSIPAGAMPGATVGATADATTPPPQHQPQGRSKL